jgi:hypothetical protein
MARYFEGKKTLTHTKGSSEGRRRKKRDFLRSAATTTLY